jgi:uncharacterized protein
MKANLIQKILLGIICSISPFMLFSQYVGQFSALQTINPPIRVKAQSFDLSDIRLLDSRFKENMERDGKWLLGIDNNRLLHSWRINAGMRSNARPYGGWEGLDVELRGHTVGHVLSGLALMYASTGEKVYKNKADSIVSALAEIQQVLNQGGYLSAFPQNLVNRTIEGTPVWAPWYTLHKTMQGLIDMFQYAGNQQALDVVIKMADWAFHKLEKLTLDQLAVMHRTEFGGMIESVYNLYGITGNVNDKKLAEFFYHKSVLDPLSQQEDKLRGLHANTQIPKIIGEARGYELTGDEKAMTIARFFWQTVIDHHTYVTGGNSDGEHFFAPDQISTHISPFTTETCNTYNMLKLTRHLFTWTADVKYADYYELALYNHILASQDPQTGMVTYFISYTPGTFRTYSSKDNSFWCCVGTGFENHAKYGEGIYYHDDRGVFVNLFIPSELTWKEKGFRLIQKTGFPGEASTHLTIPETKKENVPLYIRYPSWAISGASVTINGKKIRITQKPGSFMVLDRKWKAGDRIDITYPMTSRLMPANDNPGMAAVTYGPIVLAGDMGTEGIPVTAPVAEDQDEFSKTAIPGDVITTLNINGKKINDWLVPVEGKPLEFKTTGIAPREITLRPFYQLDRQRYVIYWNLK